MRKALTTAVLAIALCSSGQANSAMIVEDIAVGVSSGLNAISTGIIEAKTTLMEAWDHSAWVQQLKGLWDSLQKLQQQINEIVGLRDDFMNTLSGVRDLGGFISNNLNPVKPKDTIDYRYADQLPQAYLPKITCSGSGTGCTVVGTGYVGKAMQGNSADIRNALRVNTGGLSLTSNDINKLSNEAAERNAQEIAIIQAMAQEAYVQANNRIQKIEELQAKITNATATVNAKSVVTSSAPDIWKVETPGATSARSITTVNADGTTTNNPAWSTGATSTTIGAVPTTTATTAATASAPKNDLKYIADLQAQIQVQQALLANEQNKLAALAILQQSQRDSYEQRKKEIASYVVEGKSRDEFLTSLGRLGVAAAQKVSYSAVAAWYD